MDSGILSGIDFPESDEFDIVRNLVITRKSTGPAAVNSKVYKYFTKLKFLLPVRSGRSYQRKAVSQSVVGFNYRLS